MAKKFKTPEAELAAYHADRARGGMVRASRMTSAQRSQSARYARSFGVGGSRKTGDAVTEAVAIADRILSSVKPRRKL